MGEVRIIESAQFLGLLEDRYNKGGVSSIVRLVEKEFSPGTFVNLKQGLSSDETRRVCNRAVWKLDSQGNLTNLAYLPPLNIENESCSIVRVFALPYVDEPFQVELYGEPPSLLD